MLQMMLKCQRWKWIFNNNDWMNSSYFSLISFQTSRPISALARDEEARESEVTRSQPLNELLKSIGLEKKYLTPSSLKKVWLKIHPDKVNIDPKTFMDSKAIIKTLHVFLSMIELVAHHNNTDIQAMLNDQLSGITKEDELFLVQSAIKTIKNYTDETEINADFMSEVNRFLHSHAASHQRGAQSFNVTLDALSTAASALVHLNERRAFRREANQYQYTINPSEDIRSAKDNQGDIKTEINKIRTKAKHVDETHQAGIDDEVNQKKTK